MQKINDDIREKQNTQIKKKNPHKKSLSNDILTIIRRVLSRVQMETENACIK